MRRQVETSKNVAERLAAGLKQRYLAEGYQKVSARVFPRRVRANSVDLSVWVVIVRTKAVET